ncbi:hypothetical protein IDH28_02825 [Pelagibacterales bacterium SAG-MED31]|nr:hypothetical protein [Pelagibacterales bacterium SAG-MED31]
MKTILTLFVLLFSSSVFADDISDFQIDNISIGKSILKFYKETDFDNFSPIKYPSSDTFYGYGIPVEYYKKSNSNYDTISFILKKNDSKFRIYSVKGMVFYPQNFEKCLDQKKKVTKEIKKEFKIVNDQSYEDDFGNQYGSSIAYVTNFILNDGMIRIFCSKWDKNNARSKNWTDTFNIAVSFNEYLNWLDNEAYK